MKQKKIVISIIILLGLCLLCGCGSEYSTMNKIKHSYSEKKVTELTKEYIKNKYGENPVIGKIVNFKDSCVGAVATSAVAFRGFAIETDDYMTYMSFELDGSYTFADNRQAEKIEKDMKSELQNCYAGEAYLSMAYIKNFSPNDGAKPIPYTCDAEIAYTEYYDGDLQNLFKKDPQSHWFQVYVAPTDDDVTVAGEIIEHFKEINKNGSIYIYEDGIYETLKPYFDDFDYMSNYCDKLYFRVRGKTGQSDEIEIWELQKLADGIYAKCESKVTTYEPAEGMKRIREMCPDYAIADYKLTSSEKYMFLAESDDTIWLIVDQAVVSGEYEFVLFEKDDNVELCEVRYDEMLANITGLSDEVYYVNSSWGYSLIREKNR